MVLLWDVEEVAGGSTATTVNPQVGSAHPTDPQMGSYPVATVESLPPAPASTGLERVLPRQVSTGSLRGQLSIGGSAMQIDSTGSTIRAGQTDYDAGTGFWMGIDSGTPKFSIGNSSGNKLTWNGTTLSITGSLTATTGAIGGWTIGTTALTSGSGANSVGLDSAGTNPALYAGSATPASAPFRVTQAGALTASNATITGSITSTSGTIGGWTIGATTITGGSATLDSTGVVTIGTTNDVIIASAVDATYRLWVGNAVAASAPFSVTKAGAVAASNITITGGAVSGVPISGIPNSTVTDISLLECSHDLVFSVTDADTVAWALGTIIFSNGRTFSISAGNTGDMVALTYIYLDPAVSSTVLQATTTYSTAMGANKRLIGTAQNHTVTASFIPYGAGVPLIDGANIGALSITAGNIAAAAITAGKISVSTLSSIVADIGTITACSISVVNGLNTIGFTPSGANAIFSGTTGSPEFKVTPAGALTATSATITGSITSTSGTIGGFTIGADYLRDTADSMGLASTATASDDVSFWAGDSFTNRASAAFRVTESGAVTVTSGSVQGSLVTSGSITGDKIAAETITASNIDALNLSGKTLTADTGTIGGWTLSSNQIVGPSGAVIRSGQTDFSVGTGFWLGNVEGTPKFSIGSASGNKMEWDGTYLRVTGAFTPASEFRAYTYVVADLPIPPTTAGFNSPAGVA